MSVPEHVEFYSDTLFLKMDRALLGADAWRISHALLGPGGTMILDRIYTLWFTVTILTFAWIAFDQNERFRIRSAIAYFAIWIVLGNVAALALASAGPCYYEAYYGSAYFAPLFDRLAEAGPLNAPIFQAYLLAVSGKDSLGSGISAMPSVHVAMATLLLLMVLERFGRRWQTWLAAFYLMAIFVGSFHLGWHYMVDGLFSLFAVPLIWLAANKLIEKPVRAEAGDPARFAGQILAYNRSDASPGPDPIQMSHGDHS